MEEDPVNPSHYSDLGLYSALHIIERWGLGYHLGQALKYIQRAGRKPGESEIVDLKKAVWYIQRYIHQLDPTEFNPWSQDGGPDEPKPVSYKIISSEDS